MQKKQVSTVFTCSYSTKVTLLIHLNSLPPEQESYEEMFMKVRPAPPTSRPVATRCSLLTPPLVSASR